MAITVWRLLHPVLYALLARAALMVLSSPPLLTVQLVPIALPGNSAA